MPQQRKTSWEGVHDWYSHLVGQQGHYYHQHVIIPKVTELLAKLEKKPTTVLDLACGQGILARSLPESVEYWGVDLSDSLIRDAKKMDVKKRGNFIVADITKDLQLPIKQVDVATIILAIQDVADPEGAIKQASRYLKQGGHLLIVMNHPCFRIPRQTAWEVDEPKKLQYRRVDGYMRSNTIPIQTAPGKGTGSPTVFYSHYPLSCYSKWLHKNGLVIEVLDEWISEKTSEGPKKEWKTGLEPNFLCFCVF